jgi:hypothetical protein
MTMPLLHCRRWALLARALLLRSHQAVAIKAAFGFLPCPSRHCNRFLRARGMGRMLSKIHIILDKFTQRVQNSMEHGKVLGSFSNPEIGSVMHSYSWIISSCTAWSQLRVFLEHFVHIWHLG